MNLPPCRNILTFTHRTDPQCVGGGENTNIPLFIPSYSSAILAQYHFPPSKSPPHNHHPHPAPHQRCNFLFHPLHPKALVFDPNTHMQPLILRHIRPYYLSKNLVVPTCLARTARFQHSKTLKQHKVLSKRSLVMFWT